MVYERILPFPDPEKFQFPELRALTTIWKEKKGELEGNGAYQEFIKKLQREWSIETGIIERLYAWDRGVTEILITQGITSNVISHYGRIDQKDAEHIQNLIGDHQEIINGLFSYIKGEEPISEHFIRGLQAQFTRHQDYIEATTESGERIQISLIKGEYKKQPNNPKRPDNILHSYCPPALTKEEMETLVRLYREADSNYAPELKSAWLHHRFTQIHPFQDGNGRVARALASLVFLKSGLFPLVVRESDRKNYIDALETADHGDLYPLVLFFVQRQKDAILKALSLQQQVQQNQHADIIIQSAIELIGSKLKKENETISIVFNYANKLFEIAKSKFSDLEIAINNQLKSLSYKAKTDAANNTEKNRYYFQKQIIETAKQFHYFANLDQYRSWVRLSIITENNFNHVLSIHGYGYNDSGVLAVSAFTYFKVLSETGGTESINLHPATTDLFQFNYAEDYEDIKKRFLEWLESSTAIGLAEWKRAL